MPSTGSPLSQATLHTHAAVATEYIACNDLLYAVGHACGPGQQPARGLPAPLPVERLPPSIGSWAVTENGKN